jgi:hypothetical protein
MTATQVFLRFVKSQYTKENGELDVEMYLHWMNVLSTCNCTKRKTHYWLNYFFAKRRIYWQKRTNDNIKNYVDVYLQCGRSLKGFMNSLIQSECGYWSGNHFIDSLCKAYDIERLSKRDWPRKREGSQMLIKEWHKFLDEHIEGDTSKKWYSGKEYSFTWKE